VEAHLKKQEGIAMRKILVVIDMQNDFIDGSLGTKEAQQIVPRVVEKMKEYDPWNIYLTRDTHYENYLDTQEGRNLPVEHCIEGTHGWQLNDAVAKAAEKATVIDKPTFGSNRLAGLLMTERAQEALEIELVGLCTDICVVSNALRLNLFKLRDPKHDHKRRKKPASANTAPAEEKTTTKKEKETMKKTMKIEGMMCAHCEAAVRKALEAIPEVVDAEVSHTAGTAVVTLQSPVDDAALKKAVEDKDYKVLGIE